MNVAAEDTEGNSINKHHYNSVGIIRKEEGRVAKDHDGWGSWPGCPLPTGDSISEEAVPILQKFFEI